MVLPQNETIQLLHHEIVLLDMKQKYMFDIRIKEMLCSPQLFGYELILWNLYVCVYNIAII